ncbi:MAG: hypothetical protein GY816_04430 [Cytophagales bacterium]|nr:hypothetical protein [Cytophagales bacterium]
MTSLQQTETQQPDVDNPHENISDDLFTIIGLFLVFVLIFVTVKGKLRDWLMR